MIVKNRRRVDFYTHVVATTRQEIALHVVGFDATAKGHFQACALSHFGAFLLPAAVVEVAVRICLNSLISLRYEILHRYHVNAKQPPGSVWNRSASTLERVAHA